MADAWKAPRREAKEEYKLGWIKESLQNGKNFRDSSRSAMDADEAMNIISGYDEEKIPDGRSEIKYNRLKRQIRELVAVSSQLRPVEGHRTDNNDFVKQAWVLNKLWTAWWGNTFVDRAVCDAKKWAAVTGDGYVSPVWNNDFWVTGRGDIELEAYGAPQVFFNQLPRNGDFQKAYAVHIQTEIPIAYAHALYPAWADRITPDRTSPGWIRKSLNRLSRFASPVLEMSHRNKKENFPFPVCDITYSYILDLTMNDTGHDIHMGEPGTSWEYIVPTYGKETDVGQDERGNRIVKKGGMEESMLYPLRRLMISFSGCIPYDGTSKWWHGKVPLVKFSADTWPWEPFGFPLTKDGAGLQKSIVRMLRNIEESALVRMDPPIQYGPTIAKSLMEVLDLRVQGVRIQNDNMSMTGGDDIKPILPPAYYDVPAWIPEFIKSNEERMDYLTALRDISAIAKAKQIPSSDSIEKLFQMAGVIAQDMARSDEKSVAELGSMWRPLAFQWYTRARRYQLLGPDGETKEDYDYEPGSLVPSHMPNEEKNNRSKFTHLERAKHHQNNFFYEIQPGQVYNTTNLTRQLTLFQASKAGVPIDPWTFAEVMNLQNFGNPPKGATSIIERWVAWKFMNVEMQLEFQKLVQAAQQGANPDDLQGQADAFLQRMENENWGLPGVATPNTPPAEAAGPVNGAQPGASPNPGGRPNSFQKPPAIKNKGDRSTITTS